MTTEVMLTIVIVNYIKHEMTQKCVDSLKRYLDYEKYEVVIVDNCSPNDSYEQLYTKYREELNIKVVKNESNNGFGAGNNFALKYTNSEYILFLNPDVILLDDSILEMLDVFKQNKDIGVIGAKLLNEDRSLQYSCRRFLPFNEFIKARTPLKKLTSKSNVDTLNSKYLMLDINHDVAQDVDWLMGSCLLVRKSEFLSLGAFSKEYFMYFEDVDLCYKYHLNKQRVHYYPNAKVIHLHEQESVKKFNKLTLCHIESMFKFYRKYYANKRS